ncbi:MAG: hydantoinase/oxoprolinase family protein, partial [Rhodospirillaceae bacterium]|nr:hydantoinase/oxoprolinase family protein [Rhodospirillaceae bacterium]
MRVGIDVGGTHTDAVIVHGEQVIASHKAVSSRDITGGILDALRAVLDAVGPERDRIDAVMLGTTQFTNAVVQRRQLSEAAVIRLGLPSGECLPPMVDWPE